MLDSDFKANQAPPKGLDLRYSSQTIASSPKLAAAGEIPVYKVVRTSRLYEQIVQQIEESVLNGKLKPGDQLPAERELAQQLGVSRTAVREAVKALREKGLVEAYSGRGTFVTDGTTQAARQSFDLMVKIGQQEGAPHLAELRLILEPGIAALAAVRVKEDDLTAMREANLREVKFGQSSKRLSPKMLSSLSKIAKVRKNEFGLLFAKRNLFSPVSKSLDRSTPTIVIHADLCTLRF